MLPALVSLGLQVGVALDSPDLEGATVAATVVDSSGKKVFDRNGNLRVTPASNEKLLTGAFALYELGPQYTPSTSVWKLPDRVVVESSGDPSMSYAKLAQVAQQLGLRGDLPVYAKEAYAPEIPEGWEIGDLPNRYAAPVAAFSVDQSGFELWKSKGRLELRPNAYQVKIVEEGQSTAKPRFSYDPIERKVSYAGSFPGGEARLDTLAVPQADEAAALILGHRLKRTSAVPDTPPSATIVGEPLRQILADCLQASDNNMAENLLLMGAAHEGPLPENCYPSALERLRQFLTRVVQLKDSQISPADGSGLTRANLVTTQAVTSLLSWQDNQATSKIWRASLAAPGIGTLRRRLAGIPFQGKTGSLTHVAALSGYLTTKSGKSLIVSVILNNFSCAEEKARAAMDLFVRNLYEKDL